MARLERREPRGIDLVRRLTYGTARRMYGKTMAPNEIVGHSKRSLLGVGMFAMFTERGDQKADHRLKFLAKLRVAQLVGCEWCLDFGSRLAQDSGLPAEDLKQLSHWRQSDRFDATDRLVLEYAEAMTRTPIEVTDELFGALREQFDSEQIVELTMAIGGENLYCRTNWALGIEGEGFSDGMYCVVPDTNPAAPLVDVIAAR
jgi:AhpD family alkylhydroperoxidase